MCGIAGSYGVEWDVHAALDLIAHRGPDGCGVYTAPGGTALGHVRLAIRDPDPRSDQPFHYGGISLTYVGELWNAEELRDELEREGYPFDTTGDTEVVAAALEHWGWQALRRMDGMFAMAWETAEGHVYLARDRLGKVPLYWESRGGGGLFGPALTWSSERRAWGREGFVAEPIPPGMYMRVGDPGPLPYYALPNVTVGGLTTAEDVRAMIRRGVRKRLVSDVPVAFLSSGGLDSTLILALVKEALGSRTPLVAYTIATEAGGPDLEAAEEACDALGVELRVVDVPAPSYTDVFQAVNAIEFSMKAQVEISWPCLWLAKRISADGFKVVLSGEGADELFGGYGNMARRAGSDDEWRETRRYQIEKMARGNFVRTNKAFMAHGVEARLPFMELNLVESVLAMTREECPPGKGLLKRAAEGLVPDEIIRRKKETFQGASGISAAFLEATGGEPVKTYNRVARELFGGLPIG